MTRKGGLIETRIFVPITHANEELAAMTPHARKLISRGLKSPYKVVEEVLVAHIEAYDREEIRKRTVKLCLQYHPKPINIRQSTILNRTFLLNRRYSYHGRNAMSEAVIFSYGGRVKEMILFD